MTFSYICRMKRDLRRCDRVMIKGGRYDEAIGNYGQHGFQRTDD